MELVNQLMHTNFPMDIDFVTPLQNQVTRPNVNASFGGVIFLFPFKINNHDLA